MKIYNQVSSTQDIIKNNLETINEFELVCAKSQTNGYGRTGVWDSYKENIYCSFKLSEENDQLVITNISNIIISFLKEIGIEAYIKLPNDIFVKQRKIGGILIEKIANVYIVGIGINVYESPTSERTSINNELRKDLKVINLLARFNNVLKAEYSRNVDQVVETWKQNTTLINREIMMQHRKSKQNIKLRVDDMSLDYIIASNQQYKIMEYKFIY